MFVASLRSVLFAVGVMILVSDCSQLTIVHSYVCFHFMWFVVFDYIVWASQSQPHKIIYKSFNFLAETSAVFTIIKSVTVL